MSRLRVIAVEMSEDGLDNRPLGWSGEFLHGQFSERDVATFVSVSSALNTASQAKNSRPGCTIETIPRSEKVRA